MATIIINKNELTINQYALAQKTRTWIENHSPEDFNSWDVDIIGVYLLWEITKDSMKKEDIAVYIKVANIFRHLEYSLEVFTSGVINQVVSATYNPKGGKGWIKYLDPDDGNIVTEYLPIDNKNKTITIVKALMELANR